MDAAADPYRWLTCVCTRVGSHVFFARVYTNERTRMMATSSSSGGGARSSASLAGVLPRKGVEPLCVVIVGAGPAGLHAAWLWSKEAKERMVEVELTVLEAKPKVDTGRPGERRHGKVFSKTLHGTGDDKAVLDMATMFVPGTFDHAIAAFDAFNVGLVSTGNPSTWTIVDPVLGEQHLFSRLFTNPYAHAVSKTTEYVLGRDVPHGPVTLTIGGVALITYVEMYKTQRKRLLIFDPTSPIPRPTDNEASAMMQRPFVDVMKDLGLGVLVDIAGYTFASYGLYVEDFSAFYGFWLLAPDDIANFALNKEDTILYAPSGYASLFDEMEKVVNRNMEEKRRASTRTHNDGDLGVVKYGCVVTHIVEKGDGVGKTVHYRRNGGREEMVYADIVVIAAPPTHGITFGDGCTPPTPPPDEYRYNTLTVSMFRSTDTDFTLASRRIYMESVASPTANAVYMTICDKVAKDMVRAYQVKSTPVEGTGKKKKKPSSEQELWTHVTTSLGLPATTRPEAVNYVANFFPHFSSYNTNVFCGGRVYADIASRQGENGVYAAGSSVTLETIEHVFMYNEWLMKTKWMPLLERFVLGHTASKVIQRT